MFTERKIEEISTHLKEGLRKTGLSVSDVSRITGLSYGAVYNAVNGEGWSNKNTIDRIEVVLNSVAGIRNGNGRI